jgi:hypothetical protein
MASNVIIRSSTIIGNPDADDDDEFLFDSFVELENFKEIFSTDSTKSIIVGRTGAGKTALIRKIEEDFENVVRIDPKRMAMDHIANSTIISFLEDIKVDLHLFYELLWKHIICVALIKKAYGLNDEKSERTFLDRIQKLVNPAKYECIEYLRVWGKTFWIDADVQLREITSQFEDQVKVGAGLDSYGFKFDANAASTISQTTKSDIAQRARKVVNEIQIGKLNQVLDLLADDLSQNKQRTFFICIDNLDERWVDLRIQFKLIRALVDVVKPFRRISQLKIVIALRSDVFERAMTETRDLGFQKEKYESYLLRLKWSSSNLDLLINRRISTLFKKRYTKEAVGFTDVFLAEVRGISTMKYIVDRTLHRPRDAIAFVNHCFESAEGQVQVTSKAIQIAEHLYSRRRLEALLEEWQSVHPELDRLIEFVGRNKSETVDFEAISAKELIDDLVIKVLANSDTYKFKDDLIEKCDSYLEKSIGNAVDIGRELFAVLYKVGALKIKLGVQQPFQVCYVDDTVILSSQITAESKGKIHPMLWRVLGVTPNI